MGLRGQVGGLPLDEEQVGSVYAAHGGELYRAVRRSLGDDQLAEDALPGTFLRDRPIAEVAAQLSIPVGTVKSSAY